MHITALKWTSAEHQTLQVTLDNGEVKCCVWPNNTTWIRERIQAALAEGVIIANEDPPLPPTQDEIDCLAARQYAKLQALQSMTPEQVGNWIEANINTFAHAKDALKTLAIAVGILARRL